MIEINNLSYSYSRKKKLFQDLDLNLPNGRIYGLLGKNGAGKTTLLKLIAGLLYPKKGICNIMGHPSKCRLPDALKDIYVIPEEFEVPAISGLLFKKVYAPFYPEFSHEQFNHYMTEFSIDTKEILTSLSHGQKKKFLLGFALATNTKILLLDEPTNGLDIPSKSQFRKIVASSVTDERIIIISTHQVRDTDGLIDAIIVLDEGKIIFNEPLEEVTRKLAFKKATDETEARQKLYFENFLGGYFYVAENTNNEETKADLEILFNAITKKTDQIKNIFNATNHGKQ